MKIYITYKELTNNKFYEELQAPKDFKIVYPFTAKELPIELKLPKFDWKSNEWIDVTLEEQEKRAEQAEALAQQKQKDLGLALAMQKQLEQEKEQANQTAQGLT